MSEQPATTRKAGRKASSAAPKRVNVALQGGGAHGALTWGVLDRLLEDGRLEIEGISGTSAGAMNAAVLAAGHARGGADAARQALEDFWFKVSKAGAMSPLKPNPMDRLFSGWNFDASPTFVAFDFLSRMFSPYELNPMNLHPLKPILEEAVDFRRLGHGCPIKLFVCATSVRTGKVKVFTGPELSVDALLASACLPFLFQAVEIRGEPYWDGGYMGNPVIFPLIYGTQSRDVVIVQVNPLSRDETPTTAREIMERVNEISFNSSLMREMRAISFVGELVEQEKLDPKRYKRMLIHWIDSEQEMRKLGYASKLNADWGFLSHLKQVGRQAASRWLATHFDDVGRRSSVDIRGKFL